MIAALVGYLAIAVATVFLIRQLFYRFYVEVWEDDAVNVVAAPFTDRPPIDKITQLHMVRFGAEKDEWRYGLRPKEHLVCRRPILITLPKSPFPLF